MRDGRNRFNRFGVVSVFVERTAVIPRFRENPRHLRLRGVQLAERVTTYVTA
jgi:hypothetical protein